MAEYQSPSVQFPSYNPPQVPVQTGMQRLADIINVQKGEVELSKARQTLPAEVARTKAESERTQYEAKKSGLDFSQHALNIQRGTYGGLLTDPDFIQGNKDKMKEKLEFATDFLKKVGVPEIDGGKSHDAILSLIDKDPKAAYQLIKNGVQQAGSSQEQFAQANRAPTAVSTGQGTQFVPTSQYQGAPQNQFVQGQLPIGTKQVAQPGDGSGLPPGTEYFVGPSGQAQPTQGTVQPGAQTGVTPQQMGQPANKQGPVVASLAPSVVTNLAVGTDLINTARQNAGYVPTGQFNANQIIRLADKTNVGQGSNIIASLQGQNAFVPSGSWTGSADNYNQLGHYLSQQTALLAKNPAVGGVLSKTVAGQELASQLAGTQEWTENAIKNTSRVNRALLDATGLFNKGVQKSQEISNNNPLKANEYQDKWNNILNIDSIRLVDAIKNKNADPEGFKALVQELGGVKSKRFTDAAERVDAINDLVSKGQ